MATINVSLPSDGTTADVADYNTPITTIVNEINGSLDNANIAAAAGIAGSKLASATVTPTQWTNPYCFRAYNSAATTIADGAFTQVLFATEVYDYNNNFASSAYTAPVNGVYHIGAGVTLGTVSTMVLSVGAIVVDGAIYARGGGGAKHDSNGICSWSMDVPLTAGQVVTVQYYQDSAGTEATTTGNDNTYFYGHLVHAT